MERIEMPEFIKPQLWENETVRDLMEELRAHPLCTGFVSLDDVRIFMENHVFAVWDSMTLLKSLQTRYTGSRFPWIPAKHPGICQLINRWILQEESDERAGGFSHFEWYLEAMEQAGGNVEPILRLLRSVDSGLDSDEIWQRVPVGVSHFVRRTLSIAQYAPDHIVATEYLVGRKHFTAELLPSFLSGLEIEDRKEITVLLEYLKRHLPSHGEESDVDVQEILMEACGDQPDRMSECTQTAIKTLQCRLVFWNDIHRQLKWRQGRDISTQTA